MQINRNDLLLNAKQAVAFESRLVKLLEEFKKLSDANLQSPQKDALYYEVTQLFVPQYQRQIEISLDNSEVKPPKRKANTAKKPASK